MKLTRLEQAFNNRVTMEFEAAVVYRQLAIEMSNEGPTASRDGSWPK